MNKTDLINAYFEGSLSETDKKKFESLLETDAEFRQAFHFEKELQTALKKEKRKQTKEFLKTLGDKEKTPRSKKRSFVPWLAAASIAILMGFGAWWFYFSSTEVNTDMLYVQYYSPYENVIHPIERSDQITDLQSRAFSAYDMGDYESAVELFKELRTKRNEPYISFYNAIVLMQLDQHEKAIVLLEEYISLNGELKDRAQWYLALSYLKTKRISDAKDQLDELIAQDGFMLKKAKELRRELE